MLSIPPAFRDRLTVSLIEAATLLGIKPKTFYNQISANCCPIPTIKIGGRRMFRVDDLRALTESSYPLRSPEHILRKNTRSGSAPALTSLKGKRGKAC